MSINLRYALILSRNAFMFLLFRGKLHIQFAVSVLERKMAVHVFLFSANASYIVQRNTRQ
jgi:hypothetical protein